MKTHWLLTLITIPAAALLILAAACSRSGEAARSWSLPQPVSIVSFEGGKEWATIFPSGSQWLSGNVGGGTAGLLLRDGDLVWQENLIVYRLSDGPKLKMAFNGWSAQLAGKVVSLSLESGTEGREWLEKASTQDLAAIRFLTLPADADAALLSALKRLAALNPGVALGVKSNAALQHLLPLFRPRVLLLDNDELNAEGRKAVVDQQQIETLFVAGEKPGSLAFLPRLRALHRLLITNWDVGQAGPLPAGLDGLESIVVANSKLTDLAALSAAPPGLEELSLVGCKELVDVSGLARFSGLKTVILEGNEKVSALPSLANLQQLQWVGLPPKISQKQFAAVIKAHPSLRILEMVGCENVTDLEPLSGLKVLEGLILSGSYKNLEVVPTLKSLRFVGVPADAFEKSPEQVRAIQKALPDALVVPVSGLCLGSGWILLLVPMVAATRLIARRRRRPSTPSGDA